MSIRNLMLLALRSAQNEEFEAIEGGDSHLLRHEDFVLLDVSVKAEDDVTSEGEVSIPKVKVYVHSLPKV